MVNTVHALVNVSVFEKWFVNKCCSVNKQLLLWKKVLLLIYFLLFSILFYLVLTHNIKCKLEERYVDLIK